MPISTRSMRRDLPSPAPKPPAKPSTLSKPPRVPSKRVTKAESEASSSKQKPESRYRFVDSEQSDNSKSKKPIKLTVSEEQLKRVKEWNESCNPHPIQIPVPTKPHTHNSKPEDNSGMRAELTMWSKFYSSAFSARAHFLAKFKDATESFNEGFQRGKEILERSEPQPKSGPTMPQPTPLNKKIFQNIPSSALRDPGKIAKLNDALQPKEDKLLKSPKMDVVPIPMATNETLNTNKTVECVEAMEIDNTFDISATDKLNLQITSPLLFEPESESNTVGDLNPEKEEASNSPQKSSSTEAVTNVQKVIRAHSNKRMRSPDCAKSFSRPIDKLPPSFDFGIESPLRKKAIVDKEAEGSLNEKPEENLNQPNATYIQKKVVTTIDDGESVLLFTDDESSSFIKAPKQEAQTTTASVKSIDDSVSIVSSVSALVEQFEKKKINKAGNIDGKNLKTTKIDENVQRPNELMPKGATNATFVMGVDENDIDKNSLPNNDVSEKDDNLAYNFTMEETTAFVGQNLTFDRTAVIAVENNASKKLIKANNETDMTFVVNHNKLPNVEQLDSFSEPSPASSCNQTYYVKNLKKNPAVFVKKLSTIATDSEGEKSMGSVSSKTSTKVSKQNTASAIPNEAASSSKVRSDKQKSNTSQSSSSSGSMKSAVSQPSLNKITKMGMKNTAVTGSAGSVYEKQKSATKESDIRKRLLEKEEEAAKRKMEFNMRKMELQKKKNEEWKRKADTMKANEKKNKPASKMMPGAGGLGGSQLNLKIAPGVPLTGKPQCFLKPATGFQGLASKYNTKLLMPSHAKPNVEEQSNPDDSFCTADGYSFLEVTTDIDPANNYDITRYEDIDEECRHRETKLIPEWSKSSQTTTALFRQIPFESRNLSFFPQIDKYKLYPYAGK